MKLTMKTAWATIVVAAGILPQAEVLSAEGRNYTGGRFALDITGAGPGFLHSFAGGGAIADIAQANAPRGGTTDKQVVNIRYSDIQFQIGMNPVQSAATWIMDSFNDAPSAILDREGTFLLLDLDGKARRRVDFTGALITEIKFPPFDAQQREPGFLSVTVSPGTVDLNLNPEYKNAVPSPTQQKQWIPSNFRLRLGDLPCERVAKIENLKVTRQLAEVSVGDRREVQVSSLRPDYPNLTLTIAAIDLEPWALWYRKFLVEGENTDASELDGSIELLDRDLKKVLCTVELKGVGMKAFEPFPSEASGTESVKRFKVELYVEEMRLSFR